MSACDRPEMSDFSNRSQSGARRGDYVWQYEYYDDEEPVSFEGLKAHRCELNTPSCIHVSASRAFKEASSICPIHS